MLIGYAGDAVKIPTPSVKSSQLMPTTNVTATKMTKDNHTPKLINKLLFFGEKKADITEKHIKKGNYYHRKQAKIRSYDNECGKKRYFTEVIAE
jgi:hypothetical protein